MNERRRVLKVVVLLGECNQLSADELAIACGVSVPTVKRDIAEARKLGARIDASGGGAAQWLYRCRNFAEIREQVELRIRIERSLLTDAI